MPSVTVGPCFTRVHVARGEAHEVRALERWPWAAELRLPAGHVPAVTGGEPHAPLCSLCYGPICTTGPVSKTVFKKLAGWEK